MRPLTIRKCLTGEWDQVSPMVSSKSLGCQSRVPDIETDEPFAPLTPVQSNNLKNRTSSAKDNLC